MGPAEPHDDGRIVGAVYGSDVGEIVEARIVRRGIARGVEGPRHVAGRGGHAVVPAHARLEVEDEGSAIVGPGPGARQIRLRRERGVVADQRREQDVALDLLREGMDGEQGIEGLQLRARGIHHGPPAARGAHPAGGGHRPRERHPEDPLRHARILAGVVGSREIPRMLAALARRAVTGLAVVAGVVTLTFFLLQLAPGDPGEGLLGPAATPEQVLAQRRTLGLDRPLMVQYVAWLGQFARGDWGRSIATGRPGLELLAEAVPPTLELVGLSLVASYLAGILVGAIQATARPRLDTALSVTTVTLFALPGYWLGLMLVMVFTYWARWLPAFGAAGLDADLLTGGARLVGRLRRHASCSGTCCETPSSRSSRCSDFRCPRSSPARCSSRRCSRGPASAGSWWRRWGPAITRSSWPRRRSARCWSSPATSSPISPWRGSIPEHDTGQETREP